MTAWLSRAGAAPLALRPVLPGCVFTPERPQCDGTAARQRESAALIPLDDFTRVSTDTELYRCNSRIGGDRWGPLGGSSAAETY